MLTNNCQCDLCKSVWGGGEYMENIELCADDEGWMEVDGDYPLTPIEAAIIAQFEDPYENN